MGLRLCPIFPRRMIVLRYACVVVFCVFLNRGFASTRCVFGRFVGVSCGVVRFSTKREADAERKIHNLRPITHDE